ncbi:MAG: hypothetical protein ACUVX8_05330 [Candidatus Zipacnadales bacterium]
MYSERVGIGILLALVVALTAAVLLLGLELAMVLKKEEQLALPESAVLALVASVLYAAIAWRSTHEEGATSFLKWWGTMLAGHLGLGLLTGLFWSTLVAVPVKGNDLLRWAGGGSLPLTVLQTGYAIGLSALAYGNSKASPSELAVLQEVQAATHSPPPAPVPLPRVQVYAAAIDRLQAQDPHTLLRFAIQAAECEGGLLVQRDGSLVATLGLETTQAEQIAGTLRELITHLGDLARPVGSSATMLHAAFGSYELIAGAGPQLIACLLGLRAVSREIAEVILPVLVARAEALVFPQCAPQPTSQ